MYVSWYMCMYHSTCVCMQVHVYVCKYMCMYLSTCICIGVHVYVSKYMYMYVSTLSSSSLSCPVMYNPSLTSVVAGRVAALVTWHPSVATSHFWYPSNTYIYVYICIYIPVWPVSLQAGSLRWSPDIHQSPRVIFCKLIRPEQYIYIYIYIYIYCM